MKAPLLAICLLATVIAATAAAQSAPPLALRASLRHAGRIGLTVTGPAGAVVDVTEGDRAVAQVTLDEQGSAAVAEAGTWSCETRDRAFAAQGTAPDGAPLAASVATRTPSCAHRYALEVRPKRPQVGRPASVIVRDRFHLPREAPVCARGPAGLKQCAAVHDRTARLRLPRTGRWRVDYGTAHRDVIVRREPGHLHLLATGDSMMQIVDGFLRQRLAGDDVGVHSDARVSTGLSKPDMLDWPAHARKQVRRQRPDLVVVFIGANDGYPFGHVACCGTAWQRRYAKVASAMMRTYAQDGAATVFWCLLPAPRGAKFRRVFIAVDAALRHAARGHRGTVHLVDLPRTFTPGFRYRRAIAGTRVRQKDGIHLNIAGAAIGAGVIVRAMRQAGSL